MNIFSLIKLTQIKKSWFSPKTIPTINLGSILNVGATHIRVVDNIFYCNKIDIYKLIPYHKSNHTVKKG